jgi:hypothetical protein
MIWLTVSINVLIQFFIMWLLCHAYFRSLIWCHDHLPALLKWSSMFVLYATFAIILLIASAIPTLFLDREVAEAKNIDLAWLYGFGFIVSLVAIVFSSKGYRRKLKEITGIKK